jgi:hypothetical protein
MTRAIGAPLSGMARASHDTVTENFPVSYRRVQKVFFTMRHPRQRICSDVAIDELSEADRFVRRARRYQRRGEERRAMLSLRSACFAQANDARLWTLYGVQCVRAGRPSEAIQALKQATWLRERAREIGRVRSTRALLEQLEQGQTTLPLRAA